MQPGGQVCFDRELVSELTVVLTASGSRTSGLHTRTMAPFKLQSRRSVRSHAGRTDMVVEEDEDDKEDDGCITETPESL